MEVRCVQVIRASLNRRRRKSTKTGKRKEKKKKERTKKRKIPLRKLWEHSGTDAGTHKLYASFAYSWHKTLCK